MTLSHIRFGEAVDQFRELAKELPYIADSVVKGEEIDLTQLTKEQQKTIRQMKHIFSRGCFRDRTKKNDVKEDPK